MVIIDFSMFDEVHTSSRETKTEIPFEHNAEHERVVDKRCKVFKKDKGNGKYRLIFAPNGEYKKYLQSLVPMLESRLDEADTDNLFHAFRTGRNVVTNAIPHIGWKYSAKFDLQTFFDTVKDTMVEDVPSYCFIKGTTRQGLPTSPIVASLAFLPTAYRIKEELSSLKCAITVYADDVTVSFNKFDEFAKIKEIVYKNIKNDGFKVNFSKTRLKYGHKKGMRRIICGVGVDDTGVHPTRESRRKQATALHNGEISRMVGLMEWNSLKIPNSVANARRKMKDEKFTEDATKKWEHYSKNSRYMKRKGRR